MSHPHPSASRREFLKLGAAAAAAAAFPGAFALADNHEDEYGGLPIGLQSYSLREMSLDKALKAMKGDLKIDEVELYGGHFGGRSLNQVVEMLKAHDVKCVSFGVVGFNANHDDNRKQFETAKALGCKNISCDPENTPECWDSVGKLCDEYNMTAAIHPHGPGSRWVTIDQIFAAIKDVNPKIGMNDETGWLLAAGEDPVRCLDVFKERTYAMHLKDFKNPQDPKKREDVPAGQGVLDIDALVKKLIEYKFKGALSIEYEGADPVANIQKSLARIKEAVKKAKAA